MWYLAALVLAGVAAAAAGGGSQTPATAAKRKTDVKTRPGGGPKVGKGPQPTADAPPGFDAEEEPDGRKPDVYTVQLVDDDSGENDTPAWTVPHDGMGYVKIVGTMTARSGSGDQICATLETDSISLKLLGTQARFIMEPFGDSCFPSDIGSATSTNGEKFRIGPLVTVEKMGTVLIVSADAKSASPFRFALALTFSRSPI